jgi:uncharacterized protein (DUF697 family)
MASQRLVQARMIERLFDIYHVRCEGGDQKYAIEQFIKKYRNGFETGFLLLEDVGKALPVVGWIFGGASCAIVLKVQTERLGHDVLDLLERVYKKHGHVTIGKILDELRDY